MSRKRRNTHFAADSENDDATWTTWKFCTRDRIRALLHGEPAENPELRALGLVDTFSRIYSRPVLKGMMEFARAFKQQGDSCVFRGTKIHYGKEEMRQVFSLPLCPTSEISVSWSRRQMVNLFKKKVPKRDNRAILSIDCLEDEFKSWGGPIRAVQELLLGKRKPTQVNEKRMWYFFAHLSRNVEPGKPKPDWAALVHENLKSEIENLKVHLEKTRTEARTGSWSRNRCPVFCGTAMMAILKYHGFSEEELNHDLEEHVTSTRGQTASRRQGSATTEHDMERDCRELATVQTRQKAKRRCVINQVINQVHKRKRDLQSDCVESVKTVTTQMAQNRKGSTRTKHNPKAVAKVMAMKIVCGSKRRESSRRKGSIGTKLMAKKIASGYKRKKTSWPQMETHNGLANTQGAGEVAISPYNVKLCADDEIQGKPDANRYLVESIDQELSRNELNFRQKKHVEQVEKMKEHARVQAGLLKAQDEALEYRKKLLDSQEKLHAEETLEKLIENATLQAGLLKAEKELASVQKQEKLHAQEIVEKLNENVRLQAKLQKAEDNISCLSKQGSKQEKLHAQEIAEKLIENARLQAELEKAQEEIGQLKEKLCQFTS